MGSDFTGSPLFGNHGPKDIDPNKLMLLMQLASQAGGKSTNELLPFLLSATSDMKKSGISFSPEEFQIIFEALKQGKSEQEIQKMNQMIQLFQMMNPSGKK